jgi:hypothetical protein
VFSRYELRDMQASLVAVIAALIENVHSLDDHLLTITSATHASKSKTVICILEKGPLYLVAISRSVGASTLQMMLNHVYGQLLMLLSQSAISVVQSHPGYDLRNLMGGVDKLLCSQIRRSLGQLAFEANAVPSLPLPSKVRSQIGQVLVKHRPASSRVLFIMLLRGTALVQLSHCQGRPLSLSDCLLLITFANHVSVLEMSDIITPICLPEFNSKAFVYAHISTIAERLYLIQITADHNDFGMLQDYKSRFLKDITDSGLLSTVRCSPMRFPLHTMGITNADIRHVVVISRKCSQLVSSQIATPLKNNREDRMMCTRLHRHALSCLNSLPTTSKVYLQMMTSHSLIGIRSQTLEVFIIISPLMARMDVIQCARRACSTLQDRESLLFATKFATWS